MAYGPNPVEATAQLQKLASAITEAMQTASAQVRDTGTEIGTRAVSQAQQSTSQMFDVLQRMAAATDASEVSKLYTQFLTDSANQHAQQLREIGELLAKTGSDIWQPITTILASSASKPKT